MKACIALAMVVGTIGALGSLAPTDEHKPVPASSITSDPITGNPCAGFGGIQSATLANDSSGVDLYRIVCADGVITSAAR